jgi:protein-disulfide isomerase
MAQQTEGNMTVQLLSYVFVALIAFAGGFLVGNWNVDGSSDSAEPGAAAPVADGEGSEADTPLPVGDSPVQGSDSATITVIEFSNFQCGYCSRGAETMKQLVEKYPKDVKVVFKHNPLPMHQQAKDAHRAAQAAHNQGKFFEMKDWLFQNQKQFRAKDGEFKEWTAGYAEELGLDVEKFKKDFDAEETNEAIENDLKLSSAVGVRGTPHFFVNGERVKGAKPIGEFDKIVKRQLKEAKELLKEDDVTRANLYQAMVKKNFDGGPSEQPSQADNKKQPQKPEQLVEYVPVDGDDPVKGAKDDYLVTMVEFSSFQCPFCSKVRPTVKQIEEEYGDKVRIVFKQLPLGMQPQSKPAAQAALAAHQQGKFWEMHGLIFDKQKEMRSQGDNFKEWSAGLAKQIGLNVDKFKKDYDSPAVVKQVEKDAQLASKIGARGTPNFWINGVNLRGAQPFPRFKQELDKQIKMAEKLKKEKNLSGDDLYKALVAANKKSAGAQAKPSPKPQQKPDAPSPSVDASKLALGDAYTKGPDDAPVTIVEFSDFQCPYCARGTQNLREAVSAYEGKVKIAFKHYPLPFHNEAKDAAKAAMAAGEQGKFWEMHQALFDAQKQLKQDGIFEELAGKLGLNMAKFKKDMQNPEYDKIIEADMKQGQGVGVRGTPAFFINGSRIVGAQPPAKFKQEIEKALEAN